MMASRDHDHTHNARTEVGPLAHTPGPWTVGKMQRSSNFARDTYCVHGDGTILCRVKGGVTEDAEIALANARLIAAAPDMAADGAFLLARLDEFEMAMEGERDTREFYGHVSPAMARFRAAIAKALGTSADSEASSGQTPGGNP